MIESTIQSGHPLRWQGVVLVACMLSAAAVKAAPKSHPDELSVMPSYEYWLAIPPNEVSGYGLEVALEIHVVSQQATTVRYEIPALGISTTAQIAAGSSVRFSAANGLLPWSMEHRSSEEVVNLGVHLQADDPVSVYVLSARELTSDGYTAVPVSAWGTSYRHLGYYDHSEDVSDPQTHRAGGFIVVAAYDSTKVQLKLQGRGVGSTPGGATLGDEINIMLDRGETYMLSGSGKVSDFDISGSSIEADKPVGLLSYHMRTIIPIIAGRGSRDHLSAMLPPVNAWGRQYAAAEFDRNQYGDYFRVMASEDETKVTLRSYDPLTLALEDESSFELDKAGEWHELLEVDPEALPRPVSVRKLSVWEADKPVLVMMYSYSSSWDEVGTYSPFMMPLTPINQFQSDCIFAVPEYKLTNIFDLFVMVDDPADLNSLTLNGLQIAQLDPNFLTRRIPGVGTYWTRLTLGDEGVFAVKGKARISGVLYGTGDGRLSYGWPVGRNPLGTSPADEIDTLRPRIRLTDSLCGVFSVTLSEKRSGGADSPRQVDQGLASVHLLPLESDNVRLDYVSEPYLDSYRKVEELLVELHVEDLRQDARATMRVADRLGNDTTLSISYEALRVTISEREISFGSVMQGRTAEKVITLRNETSRPVELSRLRFKNHPGELAIKEARSGLVQLEPMKDTPLTIILSAASAGNLSDSLLVGDDCVLLGLAALDARVSAVPGIPIINAHDVELGHVTVGSTDSIVAYIHNTGTQLFTIDSVTVPSTDIFCVKNIDKTVFFPREIGPGESHGLTILFSPREAIRYSDSFMVHSSAFVVDSISYFSGVGVQKVSVGIAERPPPSQQPTLELLPAPNPANSHTVIRYAITSPGQVRMRLVDPLGETVQTIADAYHSAGGHEIGLKLGRLAPGLYYCVAEWEGLLVVRKLIVLH